VTVIPSSATVGVLRAIHPVAEDVFTPISCENMIAIDKTIFLMLLV
jgi:hypothetical protein